MSIKSLLVHGNFLIRQIPWSATLWRSVGGVVGQETYAKTWLLSTWGPHCWLLQPHFTSPKIIPSSAVFTHLSELFQADSTKFVLNLVPEISELHRGLMSSENGKSWKSMRKASLGSLGLRLTTLLPLPRKSRWNQTISPFEKDNPPSRASFLGSMVGLGSALVHMMFDYSFLSHTYISTNLYYFTNLSQRFWGGSFTQPPNQ